ncbi:hypothetical protein PYR74_18655 [Acinetobacter bereziniae]|nr:hypothetical protein PYR74_18655 [Acinetobacter bereziniae]
MKELSLIELELVSGASGECLAAAVFLGVSPLGGLGPLLVQPLQLIVLVLQEMTIVMMALIMGEVVKMVETINI